MSGLPVCSQLVITRCVLIAPPVSSSLVYLTSVLPLCRIICIQCLFHAFCASVFSLCIPKDSSQFKQIFLCHQTYSCQHLVRSSLNSDNNHPFYSSTQGTHRPGIYTTSFSVIFNGSMCTQILFFFLTMPHLWKTFSKFKNEKKIVLGEALFPCGQGLRKPLSPACASHSHRVTHAF